MPGRWALGISCLAVGGIFFLMDTSGSSAGLEDISSAGRNAVLGPLYAAAGRSYPAFISVVLAPPLLRAIRSRLPALVRAGALATFLGAVAVLLSVPASVAPPAWALAQHLANYSAVLGYVLGLGLFWFAGLIAQPPGHAGATFHNKSH